MNKKGSALFLGVIIVIIAAMLFGTMVPYREPWQIIIGGILFVAIALYVLAHMA
jgi:hypothetical protein